MIPNNIALLIPIVALIIPIVAILVKHQQKMAEIMHSRPAIDPQTESLRREVAEMKQLLHQQMIQMDSFAGGNKPSLDPPSQPPES